jgi:hypothetical protein
MTLQQGIDAIKHRIAHAQSERLSKSELERRSRAGPAGQDRHRDEAVASPPSFVDTEATWRLP